MAAIKIFGITATFGSAIAYIADPKKTEKGLYISTCMCSREPLKTANEFTEVTAKGTGSRAEKCSVSRTPMSCKNIEKSAVSCLNGFLTSAESR